MDILILMMDIPVKINISSISLLLVISMMMELLKELMLKNVSLELKTTLEKKIVLVSHY
jgi:hypothetical protein